MKIQKKLNKCQYLGLLMKNLKILLSTLKNYLRKIEFKSMDVLKLSRQKAFSHLQLSMSIVMLGCQQGTKFFKNYHKVYLSTRIWKVINFLSFLKQRTNKKKMMKIQTGVMTEKYMKKQKQNIGIMWNIKQVRISKLNTQQI